MFYKTLFKIESLTVAEASSDKYKKALGFSSDIPGEQQPNMLYCTALFVTEGRNSNRDYFLRQELIKHRKSPIMQQVNFQHNTRGEFFKGDKIGICGHIYDATLMLQKDNEQILVTEDKIIEEKQNGEIRYKLDYPNADQYNLHILVAFVLYSFEFPELAEEVRKSVAGESKMELSVSMEVMFDDYKLRVGAISPLEDFDHTPANAKDYYKDSKMIPMLNNFRTSGQMYEGKDIVRVIGGNMFFSGMGIVFFPANAYSEILSVKSGEEDLRRICTPVSDKNGNVTMKCVLASVAKARVNYMNPKEKVFYESLSKELEVLKTSGLIEVEDKETFSERTIFEELSLIYNEGHAATKGILFLVGVPKDGGGTQVQSILFDKKLWTEQRAREWLKKHGYHSGKIDRGANYLRFRQKDPGMFSRIRTIRPGSKAGALLSIAVLMVEDWIEGGAK